MDSVYATLSYKHSSRILKNDVKTQIWGARISIHNNYKTENEYGEYNSVINIKVPIVFELPGYTNAKQVILTGSFNNWDERAIKMKKTAMGWTHTLRLSGGKHHYKYIVDGEWILDEANTVKEYDNNGHINSVCMVK